MGSPVPVPRVVSLVPAVPPVVGTPVEVLAAVELLAVSMGFGCGPQAASVSDKDSVSRREAGIGDL